MWVFILKQLDYNWIMYQLNFDFPSRKKPSISEEFLHVGRYCADVKCNYSITLTWTKKSFPIIRNSSLGLWNMNKIVSLTDFWFCSMRVEDVWWLLVWYMQRLPSPQGNSTRIVLFSSAPLTPRHFVDSGVTLYLKSAISRTFCQGYMIIGVRGADTG